MVFMYLKEKKYIAYTQGYISFLYISILIVGSNINWVCTITVIRGIYKTGEINSRTPGVQDMFLRLNVCQSMWVS